jgi:hypothetical protein
VVSADSTDEPRRGTLPLGTPSASAGDSRPEADPGPTETVLARIYRLAIERYREVHAAEGNGGEKVARDEIQSVSGTTKVHHKGRQDPTGVSYDPTESQAREGRVLSGWEG